MAVHLLFLPLNLRYFSNFDQFCFIIQYPIDLQVILWILDIVGHPALILIPEMLYIFNEFTVCWFVLFWDVFTVPVNHPWFQGCYIVGLGLNCKFIDQLFKRSVIKFIKISSLVGFIVSEIIYSQTDTLTEELMDLRWFW